MLHTARLLSLVKNSFSLLETILSVVIIGILLINFNTFFIDNKTSKEFNFELNLVENKFDKGDYSSFSSQTQNIQIKIDNFNTLTIPVNKYVYKKSNLEIEKYD